MVPEDNSLTVYFTSSAGRLLKVRVPDAGVTPSTTRAPFAMVLLLYVMLRPELL